MTKTEVIKKLVKYGFGLPRAIEIYNELSNYGCYEIEKKELNDYIRKKTVSNKHFINSGYRKYQITS